MNIYFSKGIGNGNDVLKLFGNNNYEHQGFTKLDNDAPSLKIKELNGTTILESGGAANIVHGLSQSKILSVSDLFNGSLGNDVESNSIYSGFVYGFYVSPTNITINNNGGNDTNIMNWSLKF